MRVNYRADRNQPRAEMRRHYTTMERAATKTMRETAKQVERDGRAEIARSGLSRRFVTGFRARAKPRQGYSLKTSMRGYHRIGFVNIFERGDTIRGKRSPLIWLPLPSAPEKINRRRITPKLFQEQIGGLHTISRPGRAPLLAGYSTREVGPRGKATIAQLRAGARNAEQRGRRGRGRRARAVSVPLFVGVTAAHIRDRLDVDRAYRQATQRLPRIYDQQMRQEQVRGRVDGA